MVIEHTFEGLAGREDPDIVYQGHRIPQSPSSVEPDDDLFDRRIFDCRTWRALEPVPAVPFAPYAGYRGELVPGMICIFTENSGIEKRGQSFFADGSESGVRVKYGAGKVLIQHVISGTEPCRELVRPVYLMLVHHVDESRMLLSKIFRRAEP